MEHVPVLLDEAVECLDPVTGGIYVDATLGGGGHAEALLEASGPGSRLVGLDRDEEAVREAGKRLARFKDRVSIVREDFRHIARVLWQLHIEKVDGILMDLGISSFQIEDMQRGFSFRSPEALDMRMDRRQSLTAAELVSTAPEERLISILREYGEEREAVRIARAIIRERQERKIETAAELADLIARAVSPARRHGRIHPATKAFQALRIAVNEELDSLDQALDSGFEMLGEGGRMAVISFHSLEDRMVKQRFQKWSRGCICPPAMPVCTCGVEPRARMITRKPIVPSEKEIAVNPRARSARLRAIERI